MADEATQHADVADLQSRMHLAGLLYVEANEARSKALKEYNRLFDEVLLAEMRAKRLRHSDGSTKRAER